MLAHLPRLNPLKQQLYSLLVRFHILELGGDYAGVKIRRYKAGQEPVTFNPSLRMPPPSTHSL